MPMDAMGKEALRVGLRKPLAHETRSSVRPTCSMDRAPMNTHFVHDMSTSTTTNSRLTNQRAQLLQTLEGARPLEALLQQVET